MPSGWRQPDAKVPHGVFIYFLVFVPILVQWSPTKHTDIRTLHCAFVCVRSSARADIGWLLFLAIVVLWRSWLLLFSCRTLFFAAQFIGSDRRRWLRCRRRSCSDSRQSLDQFAFAYSVLRGVFSFSCVHMLIFILVFEMWFFCFCFFFWLTLSIPRLGAIIVFCGSAHDWGNRNICDRVASWYRYNESISGKFIGMIIV